MNINNICNKIDKMKCLVVKDGEVMIKNGANWEAKEVERKIHGYRLRGGNFLSTFLSE